MAKRYPRNYGGVKSAYVTYEKNGGIDYIRDVDDAINYFDYVRKLKKGKKDE